jgi:hypothetical protein
MRADAIRFSGAVADAKSRSASRFTLPSSAPLQACSAGGARRQLRCPNLSPMSVRGPPLPTCALHKLGRVAGVLRTCRSCYRHSRS